MKHETKRKLVLAAVAVGAVILIAKCLSDREYGPALIVAVFAGVFLWTSK